MKPKAMKPRTQSKPAGSPSGKPAAKKLSAARKTPTTKISATKKLSAPRAAGTSAPIVIRRTTKETDIALSLVCQSGRRGSLDIATPAPFFSHMLTAMLFHGNFSGSLRASGDAAVDPHHVVEDTGIVLGEAVARYAFEHQPIKRFGHAVTPMDDALGECAVDFSNRAYVHYDAVFPQARAGDFDCALAREFFTAFAHNARINLHVSARYGLNSHHMLEAMFKSLGRALDAALQSAAGAQGVTPLSTKGSL